MFAPPFDGTKKAFSGGYISESKFLSFSESPHIKEDDKIFLSQAVASDHRLVKGFSLDDFSVLNDNINALCMKDILKRIPF